MITRGLNEIRRLGAKALGAQAETLMGLAGSPAWAILVLTCTDNQSRNRRYGLMLGQGNSGRNRPRPRSRAWWKACARRRKCCGWRSGFEGENCPC